MTLRLLVIAGPTAVGKTRLGVEVAHALGSEVLSADSRQVYRGLDLGTGKDLEDYASVDPPVPYHLIDIAEPAEIYTLFRFQQDCFRALRRLARRARYGSGSIPLLMVGGSGLYIEAVLKNYRIADVPEDAEFRLKMRRVPHQDLVNQLETEDPQLAARSDLSSKERVIRALEVSAAARHGTIKHSSPLGIDLESRVYALRADREILRRRIRSRLEDRFAAGMIGEVKDLVGAGLSHERLNRLGLEYREIAAHLAGDKTRRQMVDDLATAIGRFAKRQETWFRGMERRGTPIEWIEPGDSKRILDDVKDWVGEE